MNEIMVHVLTIPDSFMNFLPLTLYATITHTHSHLLQSFNTLYKKNCCVLKVKFLFGMNMKCLLCLQLLTLITNTCKPSVMSYNTEESYNNVIRPQRPYLMSFLALDTWIDEGSCEFLDYTINAFLWNVKYNCIIDFLA